MIKAKHKSEVTLTGDTRYLAITGELLGVSWEDLGRNYCVITHRTVLRNPMKTVGHKAFLYHPLLAMRNY